MELIEQNTSTKHHDGAWLAEKHRHSIDLHTDIYYRFWYPANVKLVLNKLKASEWSSGTHNLLKTGSSENVLTHYMTLVQ